MTHLFSPQLFAQAAAPGKYSPFWSAEAGTGRLWIFIIGTLILGFALMFGLLNAPARLRRPIVATVTFVCGAFYVLTWLWPEPILRDPGDVPTGPVESFGFLLQDTVIQVGTLSTIITSFLLGLGVFSLTRLHGMRLVKQQKDWFFSLVLFVSMFAIVGVGYADWYVQSFVLTAPDPEHPLAKAKDLLFDGLLQKMDAAMFSIIAFYILSAAYRAFRIRSVEATILLATALLVMLSLLALVDLYWSNGIDAMGGTDPRSFMNNFNLGEIRGFIAKAFQIPGIRAIDFGIGVGALAMGLRLWLSLEKGGVSA